MIDGTRSTQTHRPSILIRTLPSWLGVMRVSIPSRVVYALHRARRVITALPRIAFQSLSGSPQRCTLLPPHAKLYGTYLSIPFRVASALHLGEGAQAAKILHILQPLSGAPQRCTP